MFMYCIGHCFLFLKSIDFNHKISELQQRKIEKSSKTRVALSEMDVNGRTNELTYGWA